MGSTSLFIFDLPLQNTGEQEGLCARSERGLYGKSQSAASQILCGTPVVKKEVRSHKMRCARFPEQGRPWRARSLAILRAGVAPLKTAT